MKYVSLKHLIHALVAALALPAAVLAATPVAVWDGNFNAVQSGYTLNLNGNQLSSDNSVITITEASAGVDINFASDHYAGGVTLIVRYDGLVKGDKAKVIATQSNDSGYTMDRTGVDLQASDRLWGMWYYNGGWADNGTTSEAGVFPSSGCFAFTYKRNSGTYLYVGTDTSTISSSAAFGESGLRASNDSLWGVTVGGMRSDTVNSNWRAAQGARITAIAIFDSVLSASEMNAYKFADPVTSDTTVSALNAQFGSATDLKLKFSPGVKLTMDTAFTATSVKIFSGGSVELVAAAQPDAAELAKLNLSGVVGAVKRSWLTPGVVGVNFVPNYGSDTSVALVPCDAWVVSTDWHGGTESDSSNGLFTDGLSTLKWSAAAVYAYTGTSSILGGYIDDGYNNGKGAEITLSGIPYETYDIIIYASTDTSNTKFLPKTVNGVTYTWDDTQSRTVEGSANWGASRINVPTYGINALRVNNLTGTLLITGGVKDGSIRGGIAALQIMPAGTPESERVLTLNGQNVSWSAADWKNESGSTIQPPTSGNASIVFTGSSTLTIDTNVSLDSLEVSGATNAVLTIVTGAGSLTTTIATVRGGVLRQGSDTVLGTTTKIYVADGGTFDMNGRSVNQATAIYLSGAGAGSWPWALTSSSGASGAILGGIYLTGNATIGGANELKIGQTGAGYYCYLLGFTLTKTGAGALTGTNMNTPGTGTIDLQGGAMSVNQWNNLNSNGGDTTVILRPGTSLANKTDRTITMNTLFLLGGSLDSSVNPFGVKNLLAGAGSTSKLTFNESTVFKPNGTGYLRATESFTLPNNTMTIDISEVDFTTGRAVPLFIVGPAVSLPDASAITLVGGTLPEGWIMAKTTSGRGYRLINRNRQLRLILR